MPLDLDDKRAKVKNVGKAPYNCIGIVLTFYKNSDIPYNGTWFLIDHNKVLTAAHNLHMKIHLNNPIADKVYFIPGVDGVIDNG